MNSDVVPDSQMRRKTPKLRLWPEGLKERAKLQEQISDRWEGNSLFEFNGTNKDWGDEMAL